MQHVLFLRHGQTDANAQGIVQGHLPTELNERGRRQSEKLAIRLMTWHPPITRLITSPLVRAVQTAEPIARMLRLHAAPIDAWTERHFGSAQGKPADLNRIMTHGQPGHIAPDDAEPRDSFDRRVRHALRDLDPRHVTAIVSHGGVIGSVMRQLIDGKIPAANPPTTRVPVPNCSILWLVRPTHNSDAPWTIQALHDTAHLGTDLTDRDVG